MPCETELLISELNVLIFLVELMSGISVIEVNERRGLRMRYVCAKWE